MIDAPTLERLAKWLHRYVGAAEVRRLIPEHHPASMWWEEATESSARELETLIHVLANGGHLPLLAAIVHLARAHATEGPPPDVDIALGRALRRMDEDLLLVTTREHQHTSDDVFVCYAHEDSLRVDLVCHALRTAGLSVFRDTESIRPGASIAATVALAAKAARAAIVMVSEASKTSRWVERETVQLMLRRSTRSLAVYPVVIDNVCIPELMRDVFAIDLRDLQLSSDVSWVGWRLEPLIRAIQNGGATCR